MVLTVMCTRSSKINVNIPTNEVKINDISLANLLSRFKAPEIGNKTRPKPAIIKAAYSWVLESVNPD